MILLTLRLLMGMKACRPGIIWFCRKYGECAEVDVQKVVNDLLADHHADYAYWLFNKMKHVCNATIYNRTEIISSGRSPVIIMGSLVVNHVRTEGYLYVAGDLDVLNHIKANSVICRSLTAESVDIDHITICEGSLYANKLKSCGSIEARGSITLRGDAEVSSMTADCSIVAYGNIKADVLRSNSRITIHKDATIKSRIACGRELRIGGKLIADAANPLKVTAGFDSHLDNCTLIGDVNENQS